DALGELVFVDFPAINAEFSKGDAFIVVESVKAASDVYSPISGTVIEINDALNSNPSMVNSDPQGDGWLCIIQSENADMSGLMNEAEYKSLLETLDH
ncbi:MAG: glycine cleavage system protein H, partial [Proteobacteria bacterium]|nr:glycine cleavage system protein H [Pseudomonadota bacterium]